VTATQQRSTAAPGRRSRRAGRGPGIGTRLLSGAVGLVLLSGAVWLQTLHMTDDEIDGRITYTGAKGEVVDARRFSLRLDSFLAARSIQSGSQTIGTDNLFLVVNVTAKSSLKPYHLGQPELLTADGKRFDATDRVNNDLTMAMSWVQPDIWKSGRFFFEVPSSELAGRVSCSG
jgi:hypothetical protein